MTQQMQHIEKELFDLRSKNQELEKDLNSISMQKEELRQEVELIKKRGVDMKNETDTQINLLREEKRQLTAQLKNLENFKLDHLETKFKRHDQEILSEIQRMFDVAERKELATLQLFITEKEKKFYKEREHENISYEQLKDKMIQEKQNASLLSQRNKSLENQITLIVKENAKLKKILSSCRTQMDDIILYELDVMNSNPIIDEKRVIVSVDQMK